MNGKLSKREREIMELLWELGPMFVREIREAYPEPRPHVNTLSTIVRILESKGYVSHEAYGSTYRYKATVSREEFGRNSLSGIVSSCFQNSYLRAVSTLVQEEKISVEELKELISQIEAGEPLADNNG